MISLVNLILEEQESGGTQLYHFTTLLDGLQIVNPSMESFIWSQASRTQDGNVPFFSLTSKKSFLSGYPLIQRNKALIASKRNLEDLKIVRITFDQEQLRAYSMNPYHYNTANAQGDLRTALDMIEDPNDRDEAEIRISRQNRRETLQDLRDSIISVDILVEPWIYKEFTKQLGTKNKFESLVRAYFDESKNAFRDETHIVQYKDGKEEVERYWTKDMFLGRVVSSNPLMVGNLPEPLMKFGYNESELKQLGHLVAYCGQILPSGALHYFDCLSTDEISAIGAAAEESPGNADAAENAFRTLNIQNKFKGPQKKVLGCILNMVDDFEEYLKKEGVLERDTNYRFDEIVRILKQEGLIESFNFRNYLADNWLLQESKES